MGVTSTCLLVLLALVCCHGAEGGFFSDLFSSVDSAADSIFTPIATFGGLSTVWLTLYDGVVTGVSDFFSNLSSLFQLGVAAILPPSLANLTAATSTSAT